MKKDYPNFLKTAEVLYKVADIYEKNELPDQAEEYLDKIVSAYPFSEFSEQAKERLTAMGKPIPEIDTALAEKNRNGMRAPEGFSPLKPLDDFVKAIGFRGPPDIYDEAIQAVEEEKAKAEAAI